VYNTGAGGGTADYATMLVFGMAGTLASACVVELEPFYAKNMVYFVLYVWSKRNPTDQASIWGIAVGAAMLPFAVLGINVLMGNPWLEIAHGIAMGHLYYFLVDVVPQVYGKDYLHTPDFLINFFGVGQYVAPVAANVTTQDGGVRSLGAQGGGGGGGYNWGSGGQTLGSQ